MKIYFAGSIRGGREDARLYEQLIELLGSFGVVLTEHFGDGGLAAATGTGDDVAGIFMQDMAWVAEVTTPSLGVGYELGRGEEMGKPILCLYRPQTGRSLSAMIAGNPKLVVREYGDVDEAKTILGEFLRALE